MKLRGLISLLAMLSWMGGNAAASEDGVRTVIRYGVGSSEVKPEKNSGAVELLDKMLGESVPSGIEVTATSSPEGRYSLNRRLAEERAASAVKFLRDRYPSLPDSIFTVKTVAEDWDGVVRYLSASDKPWRNQALQIIRAGGNNRKALLQDLWVGEAWDDLVKNVFPGLRKAEITIALPLFEDASPVLRFNRGYRHLDKTLYNNSDILSSIKDKIDGGYSGPIVLTGYHSPDGSASANEKLSEARAQAVKDYLVNVLGYPADKIEIENGGVDWEKFAATVEYSYFGADRSRVLSILRDQNLSSAGKKHALLSLSGGETWRNLKEDQMLELCAVGITYSGEPEVDKEHTTPPGEEIKLSVGGGYTRALGSWWRLTSELGVGPVFTKYRIYEADTPQDLIFKGDYSNVFLVPASAKVSLAYLLHRPSRA